VDKIVAEKLSFFLQENSKIANDLVTKALKAKSAREAAQKAREEARSGKKRKRTDTLLSGKLTPAQSRDYSKNELYLVVVDSAVFSAIQESYRKFQDILLLRGKVINFAKA